MFRAASLAAVGVVLATTVPIGMVVGPAGGATTPETDAVNWAVGQIGSTAYGTLCLTFVTKAYLTGAGLNLKTRTNWTAYNATTDPEEVWDAGFKTGTTGTTTTPPYGALVFYNATAGHTPETYSHVTIMTSSTEMISTNDVVTESRVHYETTSQVAAKHPYSTYVGWWLPDGTTGGGGGTPPATPRTHAVAFDSGGNTGLAECLVTTSGFDGCSGSGWSVVPGTAVTSSVLSNGQEVAVFDSGGNTGLAECLVTTSGFSGCGSSGWSVVPAVLPTITSAASATMTLGSAGSFAFTASGTPTPAMFESGHLPPGMTFTDEGDGAALLTGVPTTLGTFQFQIITATDGVPGYGTQTFSLGVVAPPSAPTPPAPAPTPTPAAASGYDLVGSDGGVFVFPSGQSSGFYGSLPGLGVHVNNVVGIVPSSNDQGYFLVGSDGGVFSFGDTSFEGSLPGLGVRVNDIVGIVPTANDQGYFLVGRDGGVFAFGNAPFLGSLPGLGVHVSDIIGIAATPDDEGYWLVGADGAVYAFGDAGYYGNAAGSSSPVSGIAASPSGKGYWIVTQNGGVDAFGDATSFGSLPALGVTPSKPVIALVPTADQKGYWLIGADGGVFAFGDAPSVGSLPGLGVSVSDIVGGVPTTS